MPIVSATIDSDIDNASDQELKEALKLNAMYLPNKSDRRAAESLAIWHRDYSDKQRHFARSLLKRAARFAASGPKGEAEVVGDVFSQEGDTIGNVLEARVQTRETPSAPTVTPADIAKVDEGNLEAIVTKILGPGLAQVQETIERNAKTRQDAFNNGAAKVIAQQCITQVTAAVLDEMERRKPREVRVTIAQGDVTRTISGKCHKSLEHAARVVAAKVPLMMVGPAGSGKSTAGEQIAQGMGLEFFIQGAASGTHEYLGYEDGHGKYHSTPFRQAFEYGGLFMAEELDSGSADVPLILNAGLANGYMHFPDSVAPVKRHADFRIIANANTYGLGADRQYVGRTQLDAATIDRFAFLDWNYDEDLESELSGNREWTKYVQRIRAAIITEKARIIVSPRASINGAILLASGLTREMVCDMVIWKGVDKDLRRRVETKI